MNWGRFVAGGLLAGAVAFLTDGLLHEKILHSEWGALYSRLGAAPPGHDPSGFAWFAVFELGRGFLAMFVYVLLRARLRPGPGAAAGAGVASWAAFSLTAPVQFIPLGFFSVKIWLIAAGFQLVTSIAAAVAGAAVYKERVP